jgi:hypothetical protein
MDAYKDAVEYIYQDLETDLITRKMCAAENFTLTKQEKVRLWRDAEHIYASRMSDRAEGLDR